MWSHLLILLLILYLLILLGTVVVILQESNSSYKAISWLFVVVALPFLGLILYLMVGRDIRLKHFLQKPLYRKITAAPLKLTDPRFYQTLRPDPLSDALVKLISSNNDSALLSAQDIQLFSHGKEKYQALFRDIAAASRFIHIEYYILAGDPLGTQLRDLLVEKALQGVQVRLLYDYIGSFSVGPKFWKPLRRAGGFVLGFGVMHFPYIGNQISNRNHRKIVVIDGTIGYTGGMNVARRYITGNELGSWRDTHFRITGNAVSGLQRAFLKDWNYSSRHALFLEDFFPASPNPSDPILIQYVTNGPFGRGNTIEQAFTKAFALAQKSIRIQTPYFLPTDLMLNALISAALRGVQVSIMIPEKGDSLPAQLASESYLDEVLRAGIQILRYQGGFLHSKLLTIDGTVASIGSSNMDFRSLEINYELNAFIYHPQTIARIDALMDRDLLRCTPLDTARWQKRSRAKRIVEPLMRLLAPML